MITITERLVKKNKKTEQMHHEVLKNVIQKVIDMYFNGENGFVYYIYHSREDRILFWRTNGEPDYMKNEHNLGNPDLVCNLIDEFKNQWK